MAVTGRSVPGPVRRPVGEPVRLLEVDPELGSGLEPARATEARGAVVARTVELVPGSWAPASALDGQPTWGVLVLEGLLLRDLELAGARCSELVGPGDAFEPHDIDLEESLLPLAVEWSVLEPTRVALLDRGFAYTAARWPEVAAEVQARAATRAFRLGVQMAICQLPRVELRLLLVLWHLASRWGRVRGESVVLPLRLSHRLLGQLVGARRPTVTLALARLDEAGVLERAADGEWTLHGHEPAELRDLQQVARAAPRPTTQRPVEGLRVPADERAVMRAGLRERITALREMFDARAAEVGALRERTEQVRAEAAAVRARAREKARGRAHRQLPPD